MLILIVIGIGSMISVIWQIKERRGSVRGVLICLGAVVIMLPYVVPFILPFMGIVYIVYRVQRILARRGE
jgi:hypothetical protein